MLRIGIIGLGPDWEAVYRPALARLSQRLHVAAVYDPVAPRAARACEGSTAACLSGMRAVLGRADVAAVLWLDGAWHRLAPLQFAIEHRKPIYVGAAVSAPVAVMERMCRDAGQESVLINPELRLRTAPVTTRVHELAATQLGAVAHVETQVGVADAAKPAERVVAALDWCSSLVRSVPMTCRAERRPDGGFQLRVAFRRTGPDGAPNSATIRVMVGRPCPSLTASLRCIHGRIDVAGDTELRWQTADASEHEQLDRERSAVEVLLDHFARRVVGGLVPVAGLDDVCRIRRLLEPYEQALEGVSER